MAYINKSVGPDGGGRPRWHLNAMDRANNALVEVHASNSWAAVCILQEMIDEIKKLDFTQNALKK